MPFSDDDPPTTLPRGWKIRRLSIHGSGSVEKHQLRGPPRKLLRVAAGMRMVQCPSRPPASSNRTEIEGSSLSRAATMPPDEPLPITR